MPLATILLLQFKMTAEVPKKKKKKNTCELAPFTWWRPIKIFFEDFST